MQRYIAQRLLQGAVSVFIVILIVFALSRMTGNPLDLMLPIDAPLELRERMIEKLGMNQPYPVQFFYYLANVVRGDLGNSIVFGVPVSELILDRMPNSLSLVIPALVLAYMVGVPLGIIAAVKRREFAGKISGVIGIVGVATPAFWLGLVLMLVFANILKVLPAARMGGPSHWVLPVVTLGFYLTAGIMRLIRSSMLEALDSEYVKLARVKGVSERAVIWRHCLRNSLAAALSFGGMMFGILIAGTVVVEVVFAWPGTGRLLYKGIMMRDYPIVQGVIMIKAILIIGVNLMVDVLYAYLDPRIRY